MKTKKKILAGIIIAAAVLLVLGAGLLFGRGGNSHLSGTELAKPSSGHDTHEGEKAHGEEGHGHEDKEKSDLDRPVEEMWAEKCEHGLLTHTCDICRFQTGTVKLAPALFGDGGRPGLVSVTTAGGRSYKESRTFTGEVKLSEGKTVHVSAPLPGTVRRVFVDIGSHVNAGNPLVEIDSHEVAEAKGEYLKKEAARNLAQRTAEREKKLFEKKISAEAEVLEARARLSGAEVELSNARTRLLRLGVPETEIAAMEHKSLDRTAGLLVVRAPQAGTVLEKHASPGEHIEPGKDLFLLTDLAEVWVWVDLREGDIPSMARRTNGSGGKLPAIVRAPDGREYRGTLDVLSGTMQEQTRTLKARVVVPNPDGLLRPGMFVTIRVFFPGGEGRALAVPKASVLSDEGRSFVFVHQEGEYWVRRPVTVGRNVGDMVEIVSGISPGQKVIAGGAFLLKSDVLRSKMGAGCAD
jgi:cobalt-zinc-cadmium efflux system membrane fusion protein